MTNNWKLNIEGMTCASCASHIEKSLKPFSFHKDEVVVDWKTGTGVITTDMDVDPEAVETSIKKAGYSLVSMTLNKTEDRGTTDRTRIDYDLIVIGGGSASFASAIQATELGKSALIIEQSTLGGTCVNIGCVPSKFLIHRSGLSNPGNWATDMARMVSQMREKKYEDVLASYGDAISYISSKATIVDSRTVELEDGSRKTGGAILVASGSHTVLPEIPGADDANILDSEALLALSSVPQSLVILGGRFVALELGQAFSRLGSKVTILQRSDRLIPDHEPEVSDSIHKHLENEGIEIITGVTLNSIETNGDDKTVQFQYQGTNLRRTGTAILSALGRRGNTGDLNLQSLGVELDSTGRIMTDDTLKAKGAEIYAAGDVVASPSLVYVAAKEGQLAARNALQDNQETISLKIVPELVFTSPQVARVGMTVREAEAIGITAEKSTFPLSETPYAGVNEVTGGVIVLVRDVKSHKLLGGDVVAPNAGDMIQTLTIAIEAGWTTERFRDVLFPYLTGAEGLKLAAITFSKDIAKLSCCAV